MSSNKVSTNRSLGGFAKSIVRQQIFIPIAALLILVLFNLIADPSFVFLTIADTNAVLFRDNDSVIEYYAKVTSVF